MTIKWKPVRTELYSEKYGYLDIHPFVLNEDGTSKQADLEGGWYEFDKDLFGNTVVEGKRISCISVKGQTLGFAHQYSVQWKFLLG